MLLEISSQHFQVGDVRGRILDVLDLGSPGGQRILVVIGKGGVGKTTTSILLSLVASTRFKTLIMSIDPAMHLVEYLGLGDAMGRFVHVKGNLWAYQLDLDRSVRDLAESYTMHVRDLLPSLKVLNLDDVIDIMKNVPGLEEEVYLRTVREATMRDFEVVVVDTPPTGVTLRVLTLPRLYNLWLGKLIELRERIVALRYMIARTLYGEKEVRDRALYKLYKLKDHYSTLEKIFTSPTHTSYILVSNPEPLPYTEMAKAMDYIARNLNQKPKLLVMNKVSLAPSTSIHHLGGDIMRGFCSLQFPKMVIREAPKPPSTLSDIESLLDYVDLSFCEESLSHL
jgi:arsenite-transporting ATPase